MKIIKIEEVSEFPLYDISVENEHCFELENGVVAHNSMYPKAVVGGGCLTYGTNVVMANGELKQIQSITKGEEVLTTIGAKEVTATWNPTTLLEGKPNCYKVKMDDGFEVVCSENHPFLVELNDGSETWIEAKNLKPEMNILSLF